MSEIQTKKCTGCGEILLANEDNFFKSNHGKYGFEAKCKSCRNKQIKAWQKANEDTERVRSREWRRNHPEYVKEYQQYYLKSGGVKRANDKRRANPEHHKKDLEAHRRWVKENPDKFKQSQDNYVANNPEKRAEQFKKHRLKAKYGISLDEYVAACENQDGRCYLCHRPTEILTVDHDHNCCPGSRSCGKCVRGLLCGLCNFMLGAAKDNPDILLKGIEYLQNPPGLPKEPIYECFENLVESYLKPVVQSESQEETC
jgi:hypothetical protein